MPLDTFICGNCQGAFSEIESFMNHKKDGCLVTQPEIIQVHVSEEITSLDDDAIPLVSIEDAGKNTSLTFYNESEVDACLSGETSGEATYVILNEDIDQLTSDKSTCTMDMEPEEPKVTKKKGRPKLSKKKVEPIEIKKENGRPPLPEPGTDGKLVCIRCKRSFTKERYFNTHKCLSDDYVDITKKEIFSPELDDDDYEHDAGEIDDDNVDEYTAPIVLDNVDSGDEIIKEIEKFEKPTQLDKVQIISDPDGESSIPPQRMTDSVEDIPVFVNDHDKLNFEANLNVDLSGMDSMFTRHSIEQGIDETLSGNGKNLASELFLYLCNVCSKVFKTLSHIRLHCLIHTDIKPFRCPKCDYASNSKGNLYTHMRRHTGQFYHCQRCPFRSVNKSHLIEHEATHNTTRHLCNLCKKDYNTQKSLINHIRKYHCDNQKGKDYLALFLHKRNSQSQTIIHQCHVCNRKFKKKIDRDRHLFVHDIKDIPNIQKCELCDYTASRRAYLEKHYLKHRVIYCCFSCPSRFLSSVRLIDHLNSKHLNSDPSTTWETLFEQCIDNSIYLPEPDDQLKVGFASEIVNLPPELSKTSLDLSDAKKLANVEATATSGVSDMETAANDQTSSIILDKSVSQQTEELMDTDAPLVITDHIVAIATHSTDLPITANITSETEMSSDSVNKSCTLVNNMSEPDNVITDPDNLSSEPVSMSSEPVSMSSEPVSMSSEPVSISVEPVSMSGELTDQDGSSGAVSSDCIDKGNMTDEVNVIDGKSLSVNVSYENNESENIPEDVNGEENVNAGDVDDIEHGNKNNVPVITIHGVNDDNTNDLDLNDEDKTDDVTDEVQAGLDVIIAKLGYREMTMNIFHKMRDTFGSEECEYCGRLFYSKSDFEAHQRIHTGERPFHCDQCSFKALNSNVLKRHVEKDHERIMFKCSDCDYTTYKRGALWNHRIKHLTIVGLQCPKCPEKCDSMKRLRTHLLEIHPCVEMEELEKLTGYKHRLHGKMGRRSYKCPYCERIFTRANSELQKHIWMHEGIKPFKCSLCTYSCRSKNNLQAHMLRHSTEKPFSCEECGKAYKSRTALRWHVRAHKDGKMFKCNKCPYEATQRSHLTRHSETHNILKRFACQVCDYSANTLQFMKIHYSRNHKGHRYDVGSATVTDPTEQNTETRVYKCLSCDYLFGNMSELKRHLRVRHHVQVQDMANLESMEMSEVQVVQYVDENEDPSEVVTDITEPMATDMQQQTVESENQLDEKTVSAVSLLQQIMNMSSQAGFNQQQVTLLNEDGQMLTVNPDTIIVQEDGEEVLVADGNTTIDGNQYIIQYVSHQEDQLDGISQEIITTEEIQ